MVGISSISLMRKVRLKEVSNLPLISVGKRYSKDASLSLPTPKPLRLTTITEMSHTLCAKNHYLI